MASTTAQIIGPRAADAAILSLSPSSPLVGKGEAFFAAGERSNVDWRLLVAIAYAETELGVTGNARAINNPFGLGPGIRFNRWEDAIFRAGELIGEYRDDYGLTTVAEVGSRWAPIGAGNDPTNLNSNWSRNVTAALTRLGGDPSNLTAADTGTIAGLRSIPGDAAAAAGTAADAVSTPLEAVAGLAANLSDRSWWIRVGLVVGGVGSLALGVVLIGRSVIAP